MPSSLICSRFCGRVSLQCEAARGPSSPAMFLLLVTLRRGLQEVILSASRISSSGLSGVGVVQLSDLVVKCGLQAVSKLSSMAACGKSFRPLHFGFFLYGSVLAISWIGVCFSLVVSYFKWRGGTRIVIPALVSPFGFAYFPGPLLLFELGGGFVGDISGRLLNLGCVSGIGGVSYKPALVAFARLG
ncbi:hypothetical protein F2Q70_00011178 [Brassica cretica]|uniref:Uncharacterized protein n=1 Tax=Brassica cretica TaxID=69181 RepID=A0A8S9JM44_BRACR|nr:hypothetical protein F2Q68_00004297 [Brassica cretica]KAF2615242.1 hypothetical protein F2Q70_00011178 [Brassica cretica]